MYRFILAAKYGGRYEFFETKTKKEGYKRIKEIGYSKSKLIEIVKLS